MSSDPPAPPFRFVSVVYEPEFAFLELQARSMERFLAEALVSEIVMIDNSARGMPQVVRAGVLKAYGRHAGSVRIVRPDDIAPMSRAVGWRSQQVLKLAVARQFGDELYVVLDAKNHFVGPADSGFFRAPDGRARVNTIGYARHPFRPALEHVLGYLGVDPAPYVKRFTVSVTPFVLDAGTVRALMDDVEQRSGRPFTAEFLARDLTEFFLYTGWLVAHGRAIDDVFDVHQRFCPTVWPLGATADGVEKAVAQAAERGTPIFSVHGRALAVLDPAGAQRLASFWAEVGLFGDVEAARQWIARSGAEYAHARRIQMVRELPARVQALPRRIRRRLRP